MEGKGMNGRTAMSRPAGDGVAMPALRGISNWHHVGSRVLTSLPSWGRLCRAGRLVVWT